MKTRAAVFFLLFCISALPAAARTIFGVTGTTGPFQLITFDSDTPGTITSTTPITGLASGDVIQGIDFRPATGALYALTVNASSAGHIYTIDTATAPAVATLIGATPFSTTLNSLAYYGFDFDPRVDRIRVTNSFDTKNLRVNPDNGSLAGTDTAITPGPPGVDVVGLAYDQNDRDPNTPTTLFGIDFVSDKLVRIGGVNGSPSANNGVVTTIGSTGITTANPTIGFDIAEDGLAFASMPVSGPVYRFYTINLATGAATLKGNIGAGSTPVLGIAALPSRVANINSGKFFTTIQAAINDAQTLAGHTIVVNAGTYNELVTVNKSVTILGARAFFDARSPFRGTQESIVRGANPASGGRTSAFHITVDNVVIQGFTVQEAANATQFGAGIFMDPNLTGAQIRNNIIQNNIAGIVISNDTRTSPLIIQHNLFLNNNVSGPLGGIGIYANESVSGPTLSGVLIDDNTFTGNATVAVFLGSTMPNTQSNIAISHNVISTSGNAIELFNTLTAFITGNTISGSTASQVVLGGGCNSVDVSENTIDAGSTRGIRIGDFGGGSVSTNILIGSNSITNNATSGLEIDAGTYTGTLIAQDNWWGNASGPTIATNPAGTGQKIVDPNNQIGFVPFLNSGSDLQPSAPGFQCFPAPTLYGINSANNNLIRFSSDDPATVTSIPINGLLAGDTIIGLDFRPATGELFGLSNGSRLYVINPMTGFATQRFGSPFTTFALNGVSFGFDFNPTVDRIRVVSDNEQDLRLNPDNGNLAGTDTPLAYASGDILFGAAPEVGGSAYLENFFGTTRTTLYQIDTFTNALAIQGSFNGTPISPNTGLLFTVGFLLNNPIDTAARVNTAFDIVSPVPGVNLPFAALTTDGISSALYSINLITGQANLVSFSAIGGATPLLVRGLTAAPVGTFEFSAPSYSVSESGPAATITINRLHGSEGTVTVMFKTSDGTAVAGSDYTDSDQVVTFGNGVTSKTVSIPLNNDSIDEFDETILLSLSDPTGGAFLGTLTTATLTILDDDVVAPTLTPQAPAPIGLGEATSITVSIAGNGITSPGGTLMFQLFGPNDNSCGAAPIFTSTVPVNGNGDYNSGSFMPTTPGAYNWVINYSGDGIHYTPLSAACGGPNQTVTATDTVLGNIATRLRVETGDNALIAGFIITGTQPKKIIVRGIGTSLQLADKLADPILELHDSTGALLQANNNWMDSFFKQDIIDSTIPPTDPLESAIVATLPANGAGYTAILRGANNSTGIGVVEAYDLDRLVDSELANISTRGFVSTGDNILIAGTIVVGKNTQKVIVRAIGPSLTLPAKMADPTLELHDGNGAVVDANDNWVDSPNKQAIIDSTIPPTDEHESAIVATLNGYNSGYTAIVRGVNDSSGIAVVEVYALK